MIAKLLKKTDEGFTLIELMAAMIILAFGVVAALQILVEAHKSNTFAKAKTMAINAAEEQLENIFEFPSGSVESFDGTSFNVGDLIGPGGNPPGLITVDSNEPHLVTVRITWVGQGTLPSGRVMICARRSEAER